MTMSWSRRRSARTPYGWVPYAFVGFFAFVFAINGVMIWLALTTWTGLETEGAYQKGLAYNRQLAAAEMQAALGWQADAAFERSGPQAGTLELRLGDQDGRIVAEADVVARFVRPTHEGHDFEARLAPAPDGVYRALVDFPLPGQWDVELEARAPEGRYRLQERLFIRP